MFIDHKRRHQLPISVPMTWYMMTKVQKDMNATQTGELASCCRDVDDRSSGGMKGTVPRVALVWYWLYTTGGGIQEPSHIQYQFFFQFIKSQPREIPFTPCHLPSVPAICRIRRPSRGT